MTTGEGKPPHHGATATETIQENPMPWPTGKKKPPMSEETKQKIRTARAAQEAAKKALVPVEQKELGRPGCAYPRIYNRKMADLQRQILLVTAEVVALPLDERALLLESAANLDALAHQLAQFLATGRIEVA